MKHISESGGVSLMAWLKTKIRWLLVGLVLAFCLWLVFILASRALPKIAIAQIAELTNTRIKAKSVDFNLDGSVFIEKLVINPYQRQEYDDTILKAETVYAHFSVGSLLLMRPRLREISVKDFVFSAQYDLDTGWWNLGALKIKAAKGGFGKMPVIHLKKGALQYSKVSNSQVKAVAAVPIDMRFEPVKQPREGYSFTVTTAERPGLDKSSLTGFWQPGMITIAGGVSSADVPAFERAWVINVLAAELTYDEGSNYRLNLRIKDLFSTHRPEPGTPALVRPAFLEKSGPFNAWQRFLSRYQPQGQFKVDLKARGNLEKLRESALVGEVYCKDVSIRDCNFPYAIEQLTGRVDFTERTAVLKNLSGRHNDVTVTLNGWARDFGPNRQYQIQITSDNMVLDSDLYDALNTKHKRFWSTFSPGGLVAVDYRSSRQPQSDKKIRLTAELLGAEATYGHFPYPLKNLTGKLSVERDSVTVSNVVSQYHGREITLNGKVTELTTDRPIYDLSISAKDIPLDSTLAAALPEKQRNFYTELDMTGLADGEAKVFTPEQGEKSATFIADVTLKGASLRIPFFEEHKTAPMEVNESPLLISDISAKTVFTPDSIRIEDFAGRYNQGLVSLTGRVWSAQQDKKPSYCLSVRAEQIELDDDLMRLLPASLERIILESQPKGRINFIADLNKAARADCPDYKLVVNCLGNSVNFKPFPYPLKDVTGSLIVRTDGVTLDSITASAADDVQIMPGSRLAGSPAASTIRIDGQIALADNAFSSGSLALSAHDLLVDERLGLALPTDLQPFYRGLSPTGRFDLNFENIEIANADDGNKQVRFDGVVKLRNCSFNTSPAITELNGELTTQGRYKAGAGFSDGQVILLADSLKIKGKSLTSLKTDIHYDRHRQSWLAEDLVAHCYDGRVIGALEFRRPADRPLEYQLQVGFDNVNLRQFLAKTIEEPRRDPPVADTSGKMSGSLSVSTIGAENLRRIGTCKLRITHMQVGKLSPLAKLLYVLRLTEPGDFAFERMVVDSYITDDRLLVRKFDMAGKAIAFNGSGWMDLQTDNVDLILTARGPRLAAAKPSVLQSLAEGLGKAVVRMEVTGNAYDARIEVKALPVIGDSLQIFGSPR